MVVHGDAVVSCHQVKKDEIAAAFQPLRKSLSEGSPVSIPDIVAARTGVSDMNFIIHVTKI